MNATLKLCKLMRKIDEQRKYIRQHRVVACRENADINDYISYKENQFYMLGLLEALEIFSSEAKYECLDLNSLDKKFKLMFEKIKNANVSN